MDKDKIDKTIEYYYLKMDSIVNFINANNNLTAEQIIHNGEQLAILDYKLICFRSCQRKLVFYYFRPFHST